MSGDTSVLPRFRRASMSVSRLPPSPNLGRHLAHAFGTAELHTRFLVPDPCCPMGSKMSRRCESQNSMVLRKAAWAKKPMRRTQNASAVQPRVAALAERIAKGQLRVLWPQVMRENRRHLKDEPGIHLDEGIYANQLRYHDSEGVLRGILVLYHEADD